MALRKRGILFFTTLVLLLLSMFAITYTLYDSVDQRKTIEKRVESMNSYVFSAKEDLSRKIYVFGFRALFLIERDIVENSAYQTDVESLFQEIFYNGTLKGQTQELMAGATLQDISEIMSYNADSVNLNITISNPTLTITQDDPWKVKVILNANIFIVDQSNLARWNTTEDIVTYVPIEGFEDALFVVGTQGIVSRNITKTPYTSFGSTNALDEAIKGYYAATSLAPRYLDRIEGNFTPSEFGIESLVNLPALSTQGISVEDKSIVDHIYFSSSNSSASQLSGAPSWFKLDNPHITFYS